MRSPSGVFLSAVILILSLVLARAPIYGFDATAFGPRVLTGHIPVGALANAAIRGRVDAHETIDLAISLPLRDQGGLTAFISAVSDPKNSLYGQYLTPDEFTSRFGPTTEDYEAVKTFALSNGLEITGLHPGRTLLDVRGEAASVESAFSVHLIHYQAKDGRHFHAPDVEPRIPPSMAGRITSLVGLENANVWHTHVRQLPAGFKPAVTSDGLTGPGGGFTPTAIRSAYNLSSLTQTGSGQTLALFELDGYTPSDIAAYENYYQLRAVPLQNVLVNGASGRAGSGADEVTLDIELQVALAPGAAKIIIYEAPNTDTGLIDEYDRIATDNAAKSISTSWGLAEDENSASVSNAKNAAFQQMAAQGQSIYAAAGDSGAYDDGSTLSVDDPGSQPYMCSVGGTTLYLDSGGSWQSESTWNRGSVDAGAGGGGVSKLWTVPSWQAGVINSGNQAATKASTTMRCVPDVSLNADPYTGYSIYLQGAWQVYGGTSCAAPLWAAFTALVNQQRVTAGSGTLGFPCPAIYSAAKSANYASDFHDIANGSTNLYYPAVTGYDCATGWGTFNGLNLYATLSGGAPTPAPTPTPTPTPVPATLTSPVAGSTLPGSTVTFSWTAGTNVTKYWLYVGTPANSQAYFCQDVGAVRSQTLTNLPLDGSAVKVWIYSFCSGSSNGGWGVPNIYNFTAAKSSAPPPTPTPTPTPAPTATPTPTPTPSPAPTPSPNSATLISPTSGSTLTGSTVTFSWSSGTGVTAYWLYVGTPANSQAYFCQDVGAVRSQTLTNLPTDGSAVKVWLYSFISGSSNGGWGVPYIYNFTAAATGSPTPTPTPTPAPTPSPNAATLTGPTPGSTLSGSTATFSWTSGTGVTAYWLYVGTPTNSQAYFCQNVGAVRSQTVTNLPTDGSAVKVWLYSFISGSSNGGWGVPYIYNFTAAP